MDAIEFLFNEHEHVRKTLSDIKDSSHRPETKRKIFEKLSYELIRHETMEHQIWYPQFKDNKKLDDTVTHLIEEENHAERAIEKLHKIDDDEIWEKNFLKFEQEVKHHAQEEEEKLFPKIKQILSEKELNEIGKKMRQFKISYKR